MTDRTEPRLYRFQTHVGSDCLFSAGGRRGGGCVGGWDKQVAGLMRLVPTIASIVARLQQSARWERHSRSKR